MHGLTENWGCVFVFVFFCFSVSGDYRFYAAAKVLYPSLHVAFQSAVFVDD
jgi:hypothetical protein